MNPNESLKIFATNFERRWLILRIIYVNIKNIDSNCDFNANCLPLMCMNADLVANIDS